MNQRLGTEELGTDFKIKLKKTHRRIAFQSNNVFGKFL